jgi:hypothetical protein
MGYGHYKPVIVYGIFEPNEEKILNFDLYGLDLYCEFTNKGGCFGFVYGLSCCSLHDTEKINKSRVDNAFVALSTQYPDTFKPATMMLALSGDMNTGDCQEYGDGIPESDANSELASDADSCGSESE